MEDGHPAVSEVKRLHMCTCDYRNPFVITNTSSHDLSLFRWNVCLWSIAMLLLHRQLPYLALSTVLLCTHEQDNMYMYMYIHY